MPPPERRRYVLTGTMRKTTVVLTATCRAGRWPVEKKPLKTPKHVSVGRLKSLMASRPDMRPTARFPCMEIQNPTTDPKPTLVRAPRRKGQCREIRILGHRDPRGPDNSVSVWVDDADRLHIRVLKADRCYRFSETIDTEGFIEIVAS